MSRTYGARPRHIAILVADLPAERDKRVIRESLSLEQAGYQVTIIAPRGDRSLRTLPGSQNVRLKPYPLVITGSGFLSFVAEFLWSFLSIGVRLLGEIVAGRAHGVQVCNPPDVYWPLALLVRALGRPWVFDHHDLSPEVYATRSGGQPNRVVFRMLEAMEWLTLRTASAVIATNESFRENAQRRGVTATKVTVVRNGPALAEVTPAGVTGRHDVARLVYLGVLGPQDNVAGAVLAAEELVRIRGDRGWRLTVAGDGETLPALKAMVAERGLSHVVDFTGWLTGSSVDELLRQATIAIQPDLPTKMNNLSTMAKTVEYLGRGLPVVAVDLLETRRTAGDAASYVPNGTPVEFAQAIDELLSDPSRRATMREVGRERFATMLAWEHQASRYLGVWSSLLRRAPQPRTSPEAVGTPEAMGADQTVTP